MFWLAVLLDLLFLLQVPCPRPICSFLRGARRSAFTAHIETSPTISSPAPFTPPGPPSVAVTGSCASPAFFQATSPLPREPSTMAGKISGEPGESGRGPTGTILLFPRCSYPAASRVSFTIPPSDEQTLQNSGRQGGKAGSAFEGVNGLLRVSLAFRQQSSNKFWNSER